MSRPSHAIKRRFVVVCAGIESYRPTLNEAERLAYLQTRRHGEEARIYERTGSYDSRTLVGIWNEGDVPS